MNARDLFKDKGQSVSVEGNKPQILDNPDFVFLVWLGRISVFITALDENGRPGARHFLFEAEPGSLLFGIAPTDPQEKTALLAAGITGSSLIRLNVKYLREPPSDELAEETARLVENWFKAAESVSPVDNLKVGKFESADIYISDTEKRAEYNGLFLQSVNTVWKQQKQNEEKRLQNKTVNNHRSIVNAVSRLAFQNSGNKTKKIYEKSGNNLLDVCQLIGRSMHIKIEAPVNNGGNTELSLESIARASRIRTREISLKGEWYKQDGGAILGFIKKDGRPVALIPDSPTKYILYDITLDTQKNIDSKTAAQIKDYGFIFYRHFENKKIKLQDLLLFGYQGCWKRDLIIVALMGIFGGVLSTVLSLATSIVLNDIIPNSENDQLLQVAFILISCALAAMLFQFTRSLAILRMEGKMDCTLQAAVWDRLLSLPVPFFKQYSAGELAMRAMGISQIRAILSGITLSSILTGIFSVFSFALLFYYDPQMAGIATLLTALVIIVTSYFGYHKMGYDRKAVAVSNHISGVMLQLIGGVTKFQVAGAENRAFCRWAQEFSEQRKSTMKRDTVANCLITFNSFYPILASIVIFYALTSSASTLSTGQFVAFNTAFVTFMTSLVSMSQSLIEANRVIPLYQRAKPILETLPEDDENKIRPDKLTGSIEVSHVSFRYKENTPLVLRDISFEIDEGDYVAIVGASGCGKSTLLRILLGFEKPETGKIYYSGQDLSKLDIRSVRRQIGVVLQNGNLIPGNILSNIVGANIHLTVDDAWEAVRLAGIEEDIKKMPMGMFTSISEGAGTISGGQKQRLMIARAIVNKPKIIFFDEATSALDNQTQAIVSESLDALKVTRVVIAHRLSTIMNCNKIIVMKQGKIVENGNYEKLMEEHGMFAELAERQMI